MLCGERDGAGQDTIAERCCDAAGSGETSNTEVSPGEVGMWDFTLM